jgi:hypothetical protein
MGVCLLDGWRISYLLLERISLGFLGPYYAYEMVLF